MTNPPPVAPVEGYYALLRNVGVVTPSEVAGYGTINWNEDGSWDDSKYHENDIIATISPTDMQAVASGELERLRTAAKLALDAFYKCVEWSGTTDFDHEIAALEAALTTGDKP